MIRHLSGKGTQDVLIAQQRKQATSLSRRRRRRIKFIQDHSASLHPSPDEQPPPNGMDLELPLPSYDDLDQAPPLDSTPDTLTEKDTFYQQSGVWRYPDSGPTGLQSIRLTAGDSDDEDSYPTSDVIENDKDFAGSSEEEDDDTVDQSDDVLDAESWLQGMSAIHALEEEFEREAAARGTTHSSGLAKDKLTVFTSRNPSLRRRFGHYPRAQLQSRHESGCKILR
jgi:hypothetical protein